MGTRVGGPFLFRTVLQPFFYKKSKDVRGRLCLGYLGERQPRNSFDKHKKDTL